MKWRKPLVVRGRVPSEEELEGRHCFVLPPIGDDAYRVLNLDGSPVMVPCTREEALEAAGRKWGEFSVLDRIVGRWQYMNPMNLELISRAEARELSWVSRILYRPVDAVGNYDPSGWGTK